MYSKLTIKAPEGQQLPTKFVPLGNTLKTWQSLSIWKHMESLMGYVRYMFKTLRTTVCLQ